jgi:hypothetical protein
MDPQENELLAHTLVSYGILGNRLMSLQKIPDIELRKTILRTAAKLAGSERDFLFGGFISRLKSEVEAQPSILTRSDEVRRLDLPVL